MWEASKSRWNDRHLPSLTLASRGHQIPRTRERGPITGKHPPETGLILPFAVLPLKKTRGKSLVFCGLGTIFPSRKIFPLTFSPIGCIVTSDQMYSKNAEVKWRQSHDRSPSTTPEPPARRGHPRLAPLPPTPRNRRRRNRPHRFTRPPHRPRPPRRRHTPPLPRCHFPPRRFSFPCRPPSFPPFPQQCRLRRSQSDLGGRPFLHREQRKSPANLGR